MRYIREKQTFLLPALILLTCIIIFPLIFVIWVSMTGWNATAPNFMWRGLIQYTRELHDARLWQSLIRLLFLSVSTTLIEYVLGFALAVTVWHDIRGKRFLRVLFLAPMMTTPVIISVIWRTMFHESLGPINELLGLLGLGPYPWLTSAPFAIASVMIVEIWEWTAFMFLLLLAGLISLPKEPFLAAEIDGAGPIRTFIHVIFPLMAPISVGAIIIRLIEASKIMDSVYALTSGGPGTATETIGYYIYIKGMKEFDIGYASAISVTYLIIMVISLTLIAKSLQNLMGKMR